MVKNEMISKVGEKVQGVSKVEIEEILKAYAEVVKENLALDEEIPVVGLGKLVVVEKATRKGRNPQTKEEIIIPAHKSVKLKVGKELKDLIK